MTRPSSIPLELWDALPVPLRPAIAAVIVGLKVARYALPDSPEAAAARLYADLHALDATAPDRILVTLPPDTPAWAAVRDRLLRASAEE